MKEVVIIGGGPSGIMCALTIAENTCEKVKITIVERLEKIGKKILATGNGKCNYTNMNLTIKKYNNPRFVSPTFKQMNPSSLINYFSKIGMLSKELNEGRVYPYTENASTVLDILRFNLNKYNIEIKSNYEVEKVVFDKDKRYQIYNKNQRNFFITADFVVFACGGSSAPILGSNGSGYGLLKPYKIKTTTLTPGLVGIKSDVQILKALDGVRFKCNVGIFEKKTKYKLFSEDGEVQFKVDGISGICVMQASSFIARNPGNYYIGLDLIPRMSKDDVIKMLNERKELFANLEIGSFLIGVLPKQLGITILKKANCNISGYIKELSNANIKKIASLLKEFSLEIKGVYDFKSSQVTVGGIATDEISSETLKLKKMSNAYICGEMIDIDGECGGYNLSWAFASGYNVGLNIAKEINRKC